MEILQAKCCTCVHLNMPACKHSTCVDCIVHRIANPGCSNIEDCRKRVMIDFERCITYTPRQWDN